jgi:dTDP-4-dehydrorhamnose 3,5-epimerase
MGIIKEVVLTPIKIIENPAGNILHAMKASDQGFTGFGEAYFSTVKYAAVKGWKKHTKMTLNLVVPNGAILFVLFDGREGSETYREIMEVELSPKNYQRLTVPPGIWMAFSGRSEGTSLLLNIASIQHDPAEAENLPIQNTLINYSF